MSIDKGTIAKYYKTEQEEIRCDRCAYGEGSFLIECGLWSRIMGAGEFCSFWSDGSRNGAELNVPETLKDEIVMELKEKRQEGEKKLGIEGLLQGPSKRRRR